MHSILSSHLRWDMWQWKRLSVLEKFENGRLTNIMRLPINKMGSKSTTELRLGSHKELLRSNEGNFDFARMLVYEIEPRSGTFSVQCSWLMKLLVYGALKVYLMFLFFRRK